jgi:Ni/Co efflux regulator RcnB
MKNFSLFLIALIIIASAVPGNAQRRRREAQKQTTQEKKPAAQKQTASDDTDTDYGRRVKRSTAKLTVPCTLTLRDAPVIRGFSLGMSLAEIRERFRETVVKITAVDQSSGSNRFMQQYNLYSSGAVVPDATSNAVREYERLHPEIAKMNQPRNQRQKEANETFEDVSEIRLWFYGGNENPILFSYAVIYNDNLIFDSTDEMKGIFLRDFKIPVGSWTPVDEDRSRNSDWDAFCKDWRAFFWTSAKNIGLVISVANTNVEQNLTTLEVDSRKRKTIPFKP